MKEVIVNASRKYSIKIGKELLPKIGEILSSIKPACKVMVISDDTVHSIYGDLVSKALKDYNYNVFEYTFKHGENSKNLNTYCEIINFLAESDFVRSDLIIALGGGVVGDVSGYAASTYMRGIDYVQVPTTLLSMIDSSVGGKTAVDLPSGKNLVGTFYQPILVLADTQTLDTLPCVEYKNGMGEGIKYAILDGGEILSIVKEGLTCSNNSNIDRFVELCVDSKRRIVERDEKESGDRRLLNLGHTFGHAIEKLSNYSIPHGECVASGLELISRMSKMQNKLSDKDFDIIIELLKKYDLFDLNKYSIKQMVEIMNLDKKVEKDEIHIVIPYGIGDCRVESVKLNGLKEYIECK